MPSKSGSKYVITEDLRSEIAANSYNICSLEELIQKSRNKRIIAVGDVTTERLKDAGINLFMEVVDLKTKMEDAQRIAEILVTERLAACVNIIGSVNSVYRWRDKIERNQEILLVIKTSRERSKSAMYRLTEIHPYEVPEAIALETSDGSSKYLKWIEDSTVMR